MTSSRSRKLCVLLVVGACSAAWAQTTQPPRPELKFEIGEPRVYDDSIKPPRAAEYMISVFLNQHPQNLSPSQFGNQPPILERADRFSFSLRQRELLHTGGVVWFTERKDRGPDEPRYLWTLFAVSEADARRMAEALVDYLGTRRREENDRLLAEQERIREKAAEQEKIVAESPDKIAAVKEDQGQTEKTIEALKKLVAVTKWGEGGVGDYQIELQKLLRSINIEIAGIQAKLDAIKKLRNRTANEPLVVHLDQMQATQDVELAGAMVRKGMVETDLKNTTEYSNAMFRKGRLDDELRRLEKELEGARKSLPEWQKAAVARGKQVLPAVSVVGPVQIYPLIKQPAAQTRPAGTTRSRNPSTWPSAPRNR